MPYHYSPRTEGSEPCRNRATCPYKGKTPHFNDELESRAYADEENSRKYGKVSILQKLMKKVDLVQQSEALKSLAKVERYHILKRRKKLFGTKEEIAIFKRMIKEDITGEGLQSIIIGENEDFRRYNRSLNDVQLLHLKNGTRGYFKPTFTAAMPYHRVSAVKEAMNEVAAYQLSQALGGEFAKLVPETTIRHYDGYVGTIQAEVKGISGMEYYHYHDTPVSRKSKIYAAAFDVIIKSQDRHANNFRFVEPPPEYRLIDNGFSFADNPNPPINHSILTSGYCKIHKTEKAEIDKILKRFVESEDGLGSRKYMTEGSFKQIIENAEQYIKMIPYDDKNM